MQGVNGTTNNLGRKQHQFSRNNFEKSIIPITLNGESKKKHGLRDQSIFKYGIDYISDTVKSLKSIE